MSSKSKKRSNDYQSDGGFVVSDDNDQKSRSKRVKTSSKKTDSNGDTYWEISNLRRVTVSTFKGKTLVHVREYYEKDGQELPGKKGISLPIEQFSALISHLPEIEEALSQKGITIPRPPYNGLAEDGNEDDEPIQPISSGKKNIDVTSDEEEEED
ncbi:putative RNA polymerase II transcriptional coactivator [Talaromyces proteolyticus]|uniref:RNA polymerase II transcriptional coactivator n=1 Tax=Talaromyces proteolyticus TaxID=1131652 RepID=A0AAD4KNM5_9EURO|nr:putative RNA polymerase II transcriptional coactivator [Talaromyces proteolyticus]KAH8695905.1 putative RNA polymerase II transcriptional coactivator [Talaromyces proteolyticus]